jgi:hypothetical protein
MTIEASEHGKWGVDERKRGEGAGVADEKRGSLCKEAIEHNVKADPVKRCDCEATCPQITIARRYVGQSPLGKSAPLIV